MVSSRQVTAGPRVPCLYQVAIRHTRTAPVRHGFRHSSYMWLFDLDEPPRLPAGLRALARFRAADHVDVRALLRSSGIEAERILVLTNLRVLGYVFNPISVYWCYDRGGALVAHVAEVHNTYGGRHAYVLPVDMEPACRGGSATVAKAMYVSPFHPVDGEYSISIGDPGAALHVAVTLDRHDGSPFRASLYGRRRDAGAANVMRSFVRYPAAPLRGRALIQLEGLRLWRKGLEVQTR